MGGVGCPADSAFSLLFCPPSPKGKDSPLPALAERSSPAGKGVTKVLSCKGLRPLHPRGLNPGGTYNPSKNRYPAGVPPAALARPAGVVPGGGRTPGGTGSPCPGGEDHLKRRRRLRRIVPSPPVPPLLGWRHCSPVPRPNRQGFESPCTAMITKGTCFPQEKPMPLPTQPRGCKGRSPLHMKSKNLPLPVGKGGGGMGAKKASKRRGRQAASKASPPADTTAARSAGDQPGKPPLRIPERQGQPATSRASPPKNHSSASSSRKAVTKPRAAASSDASAKIRRRGSVPENRQITKELSAK